MATDIDFAEIADRINNLNADDFKKIGSAPLLVKLLVLTLAFLTVIATGSWFLIYPAYQDVQKSEAKEIDLKQKYTFFQAKAANIGAYKDQLKEMETSFGLMLRQLPNSVNIESLLVDLTQTSIAAGLQIEKFEPLDEEEEEFYANTPIDLQVKGTFHQFGHFVSGLAALPRIVTLHDIEITKSEGKAAGKLTMSLKAQTYRYLENKKK